MNYLKLFEQYHKNRKELLTDYINTYITEPEKLFVSFSDYDQLKPVINSDYTHKSPKGFYAYPLYNTDADLSFINNHSFTQCFKYFTERNYTHVFRLESLDDIFIQDQVSLSDLKDMEHKVMDIFIDDYNQKSDNVIDNYFMNNTLDGDYDEAQPLDTSMFYRKIYLFILGYLNSKNSETVDINNMIPDIFKKLGYKGIMTYTDRFIDRLTANQIVLFDTNMIKDYKSI